MDIIIETCDPNEIDALEVRGLLEHAHYFVNSVTVRESHYPFNTCHKEED